MFELRCRSDPSLLKDSSLPTPTTRSGTRLHHSRRLTPEPSRLAAVESCSRAVGLDSFRADRHALNESVNSGVTVKVVSPTTPLTSAVKVAWPGESADIHPELRRLLFGSVVFGKGVGEPRETTGGGAQYR